MLKCTSRLRSSGITLTQKKGNIYLHGVCASVERFGFCEELCIVVQPPVAPILNII